MATTLLLASETNVDIHLSTWENGIVIPQVKTTSIIKREQRVLWNVFKLIETEGERWLKNNKIIKRTTLDFQIPEQNTWKQPILIRKSIRLSKNIKTNIERVKEWDRGQG